MKTRWLVVLGSVTSSSLAAAAPPVACVDAGVGDAPELVALAGDKLTFCFDDSGEPECHATELSTGATARAPAPAVRGETTRLVPPPASPALSVGENAVKICKGTRCSTITAKSEVDPGLGLVAAVNDAATLAALSSNEWIETFQVASKKRIAKFSTGSQHTACSSLAWADDTLVVTEIECGQPTGTAWLATRAGRRIAAVGGSKPIQSADLARVRGSVWAFNTHLGDAVVFQDVKSGKLIKTIRLGPSKADASATMVGDAARLALVFGGSRAGDIALIDLATDKVTSYPAKRCAH